MVKVNSFKVKVQRLQDENVTFSSMEARYDQYRRQSLASRGPKRVLGGHIASDTLGKTLATGPPRAGNFSCPPRPLVTTGRILVVCRVLCTQMQVGATSSEGFVMRQCSRYIQNSTADSLRGCTGKRLYTGPVICCTCAHCECEPDEQLPGTKCRARSFAIIYWSSSSSSSFDIISPTLYTGGACRCGGASRRFHHNKI